jgi:phosphate uptake regulator
MKRRVIRQGHNTLTITLPCDWTKKYNINPGEEIEISEQNGALIINSDSKSENKAVTIDISKMDIPTIWKYFMAVYREGYDELTVKFDPNVSYENPYKFFSARAHEMLHNEKPKLFSASETVHQITSRFIGFEILSDSLNSCIIHDMAEISSKEFESSLRRVFLLLKQMMEEMTEAIRTNNPSLVKHAHDNDINVDKFHDYCIRALNKTKSRNVKSPHIVVSALFMLELLGDEIKHITYHLLEDMKNKSLVNLLKISEMVRDQFNSFYDLFYDFSQKKVQDSSNLDVNIHFFIPNLVQKTSSKSHTFSKDELEVFNHFRRIGHYINALIELRIELEY